MRTSAKQQLGEVRATIPPHFLGSSWYEICFFQIESACKTSSPSVALETFKVKV
jgi:hypothetical protein